MRQTPLEAGGKRFADMPFGAGTLLQGESLGLLFCRLQGYLAHKK